MRYVFPTNYGQDCILLPLDVSLIPLVSGALKQFEDRYKWLTDTDYELGYNAFASIQGDLMGNCVRELIESNNRLYRLLDTALNGVEYDATVIPNDPASPYINPGIPDAPEYRDPSTMPAIAMRARLERLINLVDNITTGATYSETPTAISYGALNDALGLRETVRQMQGIINAGWFGIGGGNATLADIVAALRIGNEQDTQKVIDVLDVLSGASSTANIFDAVSDFFTEGAQLGTEGAILATGIAASMASTASLGVLSGQLDRLIGSIDGGGLVGPGDNVLLALRGQVEASGTRNVIDASGGASLAALLDEVETLLGQIRDKVQ